LTASTSHRTRTLALGVVLIPLLHYGVQSLAERSSRDKAEASSAVPPAA
jgi:hypothetical protein